MNSYLIKSKVELIKEAKQNFLDIYGIDHTPFTRKEFFYFFLHEGKKYVHKRSLEFVYSNADTYSYDIEPVSCGLQKEFVPPNVCEFLETYTGNLLPKLDHANDKFLVFEYQYGDLMDSVSKEEFYYVKQEYEYLKLTPFYNSMAYNLLRTDCTEYPVKLIDLKHFDDKDSKPFFIYMFNEQNCVNTLYVEENIDLTSILEYLSIDYPINDANIVYY